MREAGESGRQNGCGRETAPGAESWESSDGHGPSWPQTGVVTNQARGCHSSRDHTRVTHSSVASTAAPGCGQAPLLSGLVLLAIEQEVWTRW